MTHKDAMMFPIVASGALLGLYIIFKVIYPKHISHFITSVRHCQLCYVQSVYDKTGLFSTDF
jgi:hypothetical protein